MHGFLDKGEKDFSKVNKVIHISILYEPYGGADDYLYHGKTEPIGINNKQKLVINKHLDGKKFNTLEDFPEYFFIFPENFHESFKSKFDEWVHMLKTGEIREEALQKYQDFKNVEKRLDYLNLNDEEKLEFDKARSDEAREACKIRDAKEKGLKEGKAEGEARGIEKGKRLGIEQGIEKGRKEGLQEASFAIAKEMLKMGMEPKAVAKATSLPVEEVQSLEEAKEKNNQA